MNAIELKDFLKYRFLSDVKYAPDGKSAAFVVSNCNEDENSYEGRLWFYDGELKQLTDLGSERSFIWEDERHILFPAVRSAAEKKRQTAKEQFTSYYRLDIHGGEALPAFTLPFAAGSIKKADWGYAVIGSIDMNFPDYYKMSDDERKETAKHYEDEKDYEVLDEIPFWLNGQGVTNKQRSALFTYIDGEVKRITRPEFDMGSMVIIGSDIFFNGSAFTDKYDIKNGQIYKYSVETDEITTVVNVPELSIGSMLEVNGKIYVSASDCERYGVNENSWVYVLDPVSYDFKLLQKQECSMYGIVGSDCRLGGGAMWQAKGDSLYFIATREGNAVLNKLLPDGSEHTVIGKAGSIDAIALSENNSKALLIALYDNKLQELYSADLTSGEITCLSHFNDEALEGKYVADYNTLHIQSEGYEIEGWVMLPKDYDPEKTYPAVLDIHGGPKTVYGPVFYHEMQLWAGMGYFVFFCNPKGGDGRDNEFMDIRGDYGGTDFKNLMDFTDAVLKAYPQIDPKRVCVTGGSYGGFMTNWVIGHTDRFCCAASQRSISNWLSFHGVSDIGFYFATDQNKADFFTQPEILWEHSPVKYADQVKTPTLFIHSDEDYRCPLEQGLQMFTALKARYVPARLCLFHGENHELSRSGKPLHRVRRLTEITDWFEKYSK